jgi:molecular chaperone DnaK
LRKGPDGQLDALAHNGDRRLGGADFDKMIVDRMAAQMRTEFQVELRSDPHDHAEALQQAEEMKIDLSKLELVERQVIGGGKRMRFSLNRAQFNEIIRTQLEHTELTVEGALDTAQLERADIDVVLMVGGSSRIPAFADMLRAYFGKDPILSRNLDEDVARGAALMGVLKLGLAPVGSPIARLPVPRDRSSHALGVTALDDNGVDMNVVVLPANSPYPSPEPVRQTFSCASANQPKLMLSVNEGDDENLRFVRLLGSAEGTFDSPKPLGYPVEVRMSLSGDATLTATAHDGVTGALVAQLILKLSDSMSAVDSKLAMDALRQLSVADPVTGTSVRETF